MDDSLDVVTDYAEDNDIITDDEEEDTYEEEETYNEDEENINKDVALTASGITNLLQQMKPLAPIGEIIHIEKIIKDLPPIIITKPQHSPPPIPDDMIQPKHVQLVIHKKVPTVVIQPTGTEQINSLINTGKPLPPPAQPTVIITKPINNQPTNNQPTNQLVTQKPMTLDALLVKRDSETPDFFNMRSTYSKVAMNVFNRKINPATAILIGQMATNKAVFGVTYPEESDRVIRYINTEILKQ